MNRNIAVLLMAFMTLTACAATPDVPMSMSKPAPVVDLDPAVAPPTPATQAVKIPVPVAIISPLTPAQSEKIPVNNQDIVQKQTAEPTRGAYLPGDGPGEVIPENLDNLPDVVPKAEPLNRFANRPYTVLGVNYVPLEVPGNYKERGTASWYGKKFHGQKTSIGEIYNMYGMTAAHPTLPIPSYARVTNLASNKSVIVRVNDRGPFLHGRIIDLSYTAAYKLDILKNGSAEVEVESLSPYDSAALSVATNIGVPATGEPVASEVAAAPTLVRASAPSVVVTLGPAATELPPDELALAATGNIYLQLGAFKHEQGAESLLQTSRDKLLNHHKALSIFNQGGLARVQLGPYTSEAEARRESENLKSILGFKPLIFKR